VRGLVALLSPSAAESGLAMLRAYFDDSGTHGDSKVVVVAGIIGTESELESLDALWGEILHRPLCGLRTSIAEFHAYDCDQSYGEFTGWKRAETDYLRRQLREAIIKSHVSGYGVAISKNEWDEVITDDIRAIFGNAEGNAVRHCFVRSVIWAQTHAFDTDISFVFDDSHDLERKRDILTVYDAFKEQTTINNICGIAFLDSKQSCSLQAADLLAWEFNRYAHDILENGLGTRMRPEMSHLIKEMYSLDGQIARREAIEKIKSHAQSRHAPDILAQFATHFRTYGRDGIEREKARKRAEKTAKRSL
jgi:hypothetical protein